MMGGYCSLDAAACLILVDREAPIPSNIADHTERLRATEGYPAEFSDEPLTDRLGVSYRSVSSVGASMSVQDVFLRIATSMHGPDGWHVHILPYADGIGSQCVLVCWRPDRGQARKGVALCVIGQYVPEVVARG